MDVDDVVFLLRKCVLVDNFQMEKLEDVFNIFVVKLLDDFNVLVFWIEGYFVEDIVIMQ